MKAEAEIRRLQREMKVVSRQHCQKKSEQLLSRLVLATPIDTGAAAQGWSLNKTREGNVLTNSEEHIRYLNEGSSVQAPARFIEKEALKIGRPNGVIVKYK
jgi:hypothetical protein